MDGQENEERRQNNSIVTNKVKEEARKKIAKKVSETSAKLASKGSIFAALGPILFWALIIIVAIIIAVGIIMFFMTVPGMVMEQLKDFAVDLGQHIASFFGADSTEFVSDEQKYEVLDYLEQMGYDIKGYGFINKNENENDANYDEKTGVIRDPDTGLIKSANTDIIGLYLMSDNYVYTVKNFNQKGWRQFLLSTLKLVNPIVGGVLDWVIDTSGWGKGLITIIFEDGKEYQPDIIDQLFGTSTSWLNIKVDPSSKIMKIRRGWGANYYEYNMDGWTGRYGMPLEFLLSLHIATMKPDLTYEMITNFETDVLIKLKDVTGSITAAYKTDSGNYITYEQIESATQSFYSKGGFNDFLTWLDQTRLTKEEAQAIFDLGFDHAKEGCECFDENGNLKTNDDGELIALDGNCKAYIKEAISELRNVNTYKMKTYVPYLSKVTNHWFRDVYWELDSSEMGTIELVRTDLDYEKKVNERWTLYETDEKGEFKLYKLNDDGSYGELYEGNQEKANEEGIAVAKKPVKTTINDLGTEGIIDKSRITSDGWSAYDTEGTASGSYERVYPDDDESTIKGRLYYKEQMSNNVVQKEDGVRGVTNNEIKKMFLINKYLSYDGSSETADAIMQIKNKLNIKFGALTDEQLDKELKKDLNITLDSDTNTEEPLKVSDFASSVSITQDSLGAFSMLENTHTLDADYIYRDFKELIVELGYFTKEELSEGTPKLLQWLIPTIGSSGYPKRVLDKNENELGTFAYSKQDYEANKKDTLIAAYEKAEKERENGERDENIESGSVDIPNAEVSGITLNNGKTSTQSVGNIQKLDSKNNIEQIVGAMGQDFERISESGDGYEFKVKTGSVEYTHYYQFMGSYAEKTFTWSGQTKTLHRAACGPTSCINLLTGYGLDVNPTNNIVGISFDATINGCGAFMESYGVTGQVIDSSNYKSAIEEAFSQGRPIITLMNNSNGGFWTSGGHFVAMVGQDSNGNIITLDSGSSNPERHTYTGGIDGLLISLVGLWVADEAPDGSKMISNPYEGYLGDEAVVSPVTGILLEYGTYDEDDTDYRKNINKTDKTDKVGYAKILVLNEEVADQLVTCSTHSKDSDSKKGISGIIGKSEPENTDELKGWNEDAQAIYGYKYFKDDYVDGGIAGYLVYIDGFKCELPNEESQNEKNREEIVWDEDYTAGSGQELSMEYFKNLAARGSEKSMFKSCEYEETLYESDKVYKLLSEKLEDKQKARAEAKNLAAPLYSFTGTLDGETQELLIIKEGTVIGRTYTDKEIVELRGETYTKPEEPKEGEEDTREVQGNYLRIIFRDLDDTVVENVEDYMKLDEGEYTQELEMEKFLYWLGVYLEGGVLKQEGGKWVSVSKDLNDGVGGTHYFGLTHYVSDLAKKLGYDVGNWSDDKDLEMLVDVYLALIEEDKEYVKSELGESISDGYLQAFISIKHNYGNLTKRGDEYKSSGKVSESTWCTYEGTQYKEALTKRRVAEWYIITEGKYMNAYEGNTAEIDFPSETPFTDWCKEHGVTNIQVNKTD